MWLLHRSKPALVLPHHPRAKHHPARAQQDPYTLLGVQRGATEKDIKRAYRRQALKLHPDVNKAPDAEQRFAEVKAAYQALTDPTTRTSYEKHQPGGGGFGGWQDPLRNYGTGSSWQPPAGQRGTRAPPEETYTFDQMVNDLGKELNDWSAQRRAKKGGDKEKSLWEELADIGEEFVEALEEGLGLDASTQEQARPRGKYSWVDDIDTGAPGDATRTSSARARGSNQGQAAPPPPPTPPRSKAEEVEDELAALKRKLGM